MTAHALAYRTARRAIRPKAPLLVSEWADANRILSEEGSAEPGQWRTSRNPPQREILDALSEDAPGEKVALMKPSQWGGTEIGSNFVGKDLDAIRATLKQEVFGALAEMEREFSKHIEQMGSEE